VDLLLGLRPPTAGRLTINGIDLDEIPRAWWYSNAALVDQQPRLISGRIDDNIRFFRPWVSVHEIERAARHAHIAGVIEDMPDAYATVLGAGGGGLSGGQKQRLSIARALAGSPEFVVLDEPTSALDMTSESEVVEALQSLRGDTTVVIVSHRPSVLRLCDRVIVLIDGSIAADGKPEEVRETSAFFRRMMVEGEAAD
jgi:ABC-type multidrug transport system fused ATPase/permease subunit